MKRMLLLTMIVVGVAPLPKTSFGGLPQVTDTQDQPIIRKIPKQPERYCFVNDACERRSVTVCEMSECAQRLPSFCFMEDRC